MRTIAIIAAIAAGNGAIGFKGEMPPEMVIHEDRRIFAEKTAGGVLLCGRYTAEQMCGVLGKRPDGRTLVGIHGGEWHTKDLPMGDYTSWWTRHGPYSLEAVAAAYLDRNIWICGGARLYAEAMRNPFVTEMHISHMDGFPDADTFFPRFDTSGGLRGIVAGGSKWDVVSTVDGKEFSHRVYRRI